MPSKRNLIIALAATAVSGVAALAYWMTTPSYALVDIGYVSKDLSGRVDTSKMATQWIDAAVVNVTNEAMSSGGSGFEQLGAAMAIGMIQSMRPGLEAQVKTELTKTIAEMDQGIASGNRPKVSKLVRDGKSQAIVGFDHPELGTVETVMSNESGRWQFVGFTDETIQQLLELQQNSQVASTSTPALAPVTPVATAPIEPQIAPAPSPQPVSAVSNSVGLVAQLTAKDTKAQINVRVSPSIAAKAQHYGVVGDSVLIQEQATDEKGATWYQVKFSVSGAEGWVRSDFVLTEDRD